MIERITQAVKGAFGPIVKEMEDASEVDQMEEDLQEVEEIIQPIISKLYEGAGGPPPTAEGDEDDQERDEL